IRDCSANKGGVTSSSLAEVLPSFLLGNRYEEILVKHQKNKIELVKSVFSMIERNAIAETKMLLELGEKTGKPLHVLSMETSEMLLQLQEYLYTKLNKLKKYTALIEKIVSIYVPENLVKILGIKRIMQILNKHEMRPYLDAMITKKIAQSALYQYASDWDNFYFRLKENFIGTIEGLFL
ncbi:MAG: NAD-glutamate dehydrogenase domain-containing protein, partial [Candidatus Ratteibacteria bacterium]